MVFLDAVTGRQMGTYGNYAHADMPPFPAKTGHTIRWANQPAAKHDNNNTHTHTHTHTQSHTHIHTHSRFQELQPADTVQTAFKRIVPRAGSLRFLDLSMLAVMAIEGDKQLPPPHPPPPPSGQQTARALSLSLSAGVMVCGRGEV